MSRHEDARSRLLDLGVLVHPSSSELVTAASWRQLQRTPEGVPLLLREGQQRYLDAVGADWNASLADLSVISGPARRHLSHYTPQVDPEDAEGAALRSAVARLLAQHVERRPRSLGVELGCSTGPDVGSLAAVVDCVVALDSYIVPLRWLACRLSGQRPRYVRRIRGEHYQEGGYAEPLAKQAAAVVPVCANALDPPLRAESVDVVLALNILDSIHSPLTLLGQIDALLKPGGIAVLGSPFHWRDTITPRLEQLSSVYPNLDGPSAVAQILAGRHPDMPQIHWETLSQEDVVWNLRDHPRCVSRFEVWLTVARKRVGAK